MLVLAAAVAFRHMFSHTFPAVVPMLSLSHASPAISLLTSQSQASPMLHAAVMPLPVVPEVSPTTPADPSEMCKYSVYKSVLSARLIFSECVCAVLWK